MLMENLFHSWNLIYRITCSIIVVCISLKALCLPRINICLILMEKSNFLTMIFIEFLMSSEYTILWCHWSHNVPAKNFFFVVYETSKNIKIYCNIKEVKIIKVRVQQELEFKIWRSLHNDYQYVSLRVRVCAHIFPYVNSEADLSCIEIQYPSTHQVIGITNATLIFLGKHDENNS